MGKIENKLIQKVVACLIILIVVVVAISLTLGRNNKALNDENSTLSDNIDMLHQYIELKSEYSLKTSEYNDMTDDLIDNYDSNSDVKDMMQYLYNIEQDMGIYSTSLEIEERVDVGTFTYNSETVHEYEIAASFSYSSTYDELVEFIKSETGYENHIIITSLTMSYDSSTSGVSGTMSIVKHSLSIGDNDFDDDMDTGIDGVFGTGNGD